MTAACATAGVTIVVDVLPNHMSGATSASVGFGGSSYSKFEYPAVPYTAANFHADCTIDTSNATSTWDCELDNLADLDTSQTVVRDAEIAYFNDLLSLGAGGFRFDSARYVNTTDLAVIVDGLDGSPFLYSEVWSDSSQAVWQANYTAITHVMEFYATEALASAFVDDGGVSNLIYVSSVLLSLLHTYPPTNLLQRTQYFPGSGYTASDRAIAFVADHDTERTTGYLNYLSPNNGYVLANVFLLAHPYGTPCILSGYNFTSYDQGAPLNADDTVADTVCGEDGWRCEHRWTAIVGMTQFHNAVKGEEQADVVVTSTNRISFGRGAKGFVAINFESTAWTVTLATEVPDGSYCDVVHYSSACSSPTVTVSGGEVALTVAAYDAVAFFSSSSTASASASATTAASTSKSSATSSSRTTTTTTKTTTTSSSTRTTTTTKKTTTTTKAASTTRKSSSHGGRRMRVMARQQ